MQMNPTLSAVLDTSGARPALRDASHVRDHIDALVRLAVFGDETERSLARYAIHAAAPQLGVVSSSIAGLYAARGRGEVAGFTVPAVNVRGMSYDMSRSLFRAMQATDAAAVVFEQARSELVYTQQDQAELAAVVLAAAIAEGYEGPVFLQGDHYQANAKRFAVDAEAETRALEDLVRKAVAAQFYNTDIDASTLVDLSFERVADQQAPNARLTAHLAQLVRSLQPDGVTISIGGEIGEVGKKNSTVEELCAYMDGFLSELARLGTGLKGISKISVQTGTSHGGVPLADGRVASVKVDFDTLRDLSRVARERYRLAGAVQHGASTLPEEAFDHFPRVATAEIHLATGFQNLLYEHPAFPEELRREVRDYCFRACAGERKDGETDEQFLYKTRKKAFGPLKRKLSDLPTTARDAIGRSLEERFALLFGKLAVTGTRGLTERFAARVDLPLTRPAVL
jgi:fructose/tagatose bisphosphate aldolase